MKKFRPFILAILCSITLLNYVSPEKKSDCSHVVCTLEFRYLTVNILNREGTIYLADKVATYNATGKLLYEQNAPSTFVSEAYVVITDNNLKDLVKGENNKLELRIFKDGVVKKSVNYVASADCCHVDKISGPDTIIVD